MAQTARVAQSASAVGVGLRNLQPEGEGREAALVQAKEVAGEVQGVHHGPWGHRESVEALGLREATSKRALWASTTALEEGRDRGTTSARGASWSIHR